MHKEPPLPFLLSETNWYQTLGQSQYFEEHDDHARKMETSILLHIGHYLVLPLSKAGKGKEHLSTLKGVQNRTTWIPHEWKKVTTNTGVGNPKKASAEKGERYIDDLSISIADFIVELSQANIDNLYEY